MFNFENLHRNKKLAFLDGLLCGLLATYFLYNRLKDKTELDHHRSIVNAKAGEWNAGYEVGAESTKMDLAPYVDMADYEETEGKPYYKK